MAQANVGGAVGAGGGWASEASGWSWRWLRGALGVGRMRVVEGLGMGWDAPSVLWDGGDGYLGRWPRLT